MLTTAWPRRVAFRPHDFEALTFERGGGDSLEVAIIDEHFSGNNAADIADLFTVLEDGASTRETQTPPEFVFCAIPAGHTIRYDQP